MREAETNEARGSHCTPLRRAKSATRRRMTSVAARALPNRAKGQCHGTPHARAANEVDGQSVVFEDLEHPQMCQAGSRPHAHGHAHLPAAEPPHEVVERRLACPRPVVARCRSLDLVARERMAPALHGRRLRERPAPPDDGCGERVREAEQIVCGDQQRVIGIEVRQQGRTAGQAGADQQQGVARPFVAPAANALRPVCNVVARHVVVLGAGRVVVQAPAQRGQQDPVALLPDRHQHDARPVAGARRVRSRKRIPSKVATLRKNAVSCAIASKRTGAESTQARASRCATTVAETGSPVSADSSPKHCGGTSSTRRPPPASSTRTAPSISPNSSADGTPARRMMSPASKRRVCRCLSTCASAVAETLANSGCRASEGSQRYFCQSELLKRPCGSTRDLSCRSCTISG